jgi:hypothetical protein
MIRRGFDEGFLFSPEPGHYLCVCSRCLKQIRPREPLLRLLGDLPAVGTLEFRYCTQCVVTDQSANIKANHHQDDPRLQQWRANAHLHPRFKMSQVDFRKYLANVKRNRTLLNAGLMKPWWQ